MKIGASQIHFHWPLWGGEVFSPFGSAQLWFYNSSPKCVSQSFCFPLFLMHLCWKKNTFEYHYDGKNITGERQSQPKRNIHSPLLGSFYGSRLCLSKAVKWTCTRHLIAFLAPQVASLFGAISTFWCWMKRRSAALYAMPMKVGYFSGPELLILIARWVFDGWCYCHLRVRWRPVFTFSQAANFAHLH